MVTFISHTTALNYWLSHRRSLDSRVPQVVRAPLSCSHAPTRPEIEDILEQPYGFEAPLHYLVDCDGKKRPSPLSYAHVCTRQLPQSSFRKINKQINLCSPELALIQTAPQHSIIEQIELQFRLCATYAINPFDAHGVSPRVPATSCAKTRAFVQAATGLDGCRKAARACRYVVDGAASPREVCLVMLLCLPYSLGGYGLPLPHLNYRIEPSSTAHKFVTKNYYKGDLYWPQARINVEYDSDLEHAGAFNNAADAQRRSDLKYLGVSTTSVTNGQIKSELQLTRIAKHLAHDLGTRKPAKVFQPSSQRTQLRRFLLASS